MRSALAADLTAYVTNAEGGVDRSTVVRPTCKGCWH